MDTSDHGLSHPLKGPGAVTKVSKSLKMHWWSSSLFWNGAQYARVSKCAHR